MIQEISQHIVREFRPDKVILFGSHAYGNPRIESDVDFLIIMASSRRPMERAVPIVRKCRPPFVAMDVIVRTPEEIAERLRVGDAFFTEIMQRGRVLYDRSLS
jgi:predicted nucleotidyltransferase